VWHAPLGVRSAKRRHQSPEWTILSHSYCLIQGEIVKPQVLLDSLHRRSTRTSWWSPPVVRRGSSYDTPGICLVWHSRNVAKQRKTCDGRRWLRLCCVVVYGHRSWRHHQEQHNAEQVREADAGAEVCYSNHPGQERPDGLCSDWSVLVKL